VIQNVRVAYGFIIIPELGPEFDVKIHCFCDREVNEVLIGSGFIKRFKMLFDGPERQSSII